jgi:hypothetical protein
MENLTVAVFTNLVCRITHICRMQCGEGKPDLPIGQEAAAFAHQPISTAQSRALHALINHNKRHICRRMGEPWRVENLEE